jgi:hypothetical protein
MLRNMTLSIQLAALPFFFFYTSTFLNPRMKPIKSFGGCKAQILHKNPQLEFPSREFCNLNT